MSKSKKYFLVISVVFVLAVIVVSIDISSRTSFPGSKKLLPTAISSGGEVPDSLTADTTQTAPAE